MAQPVTDDELQLRKRARRRLVGAIVLVLLVVVFLPMVLDHEPKPLGPTVAITIPPQDSAESKFPEQSPAAPAATAPNGVAGSPGTVPAPAAPAAGLSEAKPPEPPVVPSQMPPLVPAASAPTVPASTAKAVATKPEAATAKTGEARKTDEAGKSEPASKPDQPEKKREESRKPDEAPKAEAPLVPVPPDAAPATKPAAPATSSPWVIQLGAFSDENNARQLVERVRALDVPAYTETVKTAAGVKMRVRAGPFAAHDSANAARTKLLSLKLAQSDLKVVRQGE